MREWKNIFHANGKQKKAGVAILVTDKIDLKKKDTRDKEGHYIMIKGSIQDENNNSRWCDRSPRADILKYEVKWALGSITMNKARGSDGTPLELFQILKDDAVKVLHSICQQIWKNQQWPQDWKGQFSFQSQRKAMPKNAQITAQLHSSHTLVKL